MPKNIKKLIEKFYPEDNIILYDNFDEALVGVVEGFDGIPRACYDYKKCINIITIISVCYLKPILSSR